MRERIGHIQLDTDTPYLIKENSISRGHMADRYKLCFTIFPMLGLMQSSVSSNLPVLALNSF